MANRWPLLDRQESTLRLTSWMRRNIESSDQVLESVRTTLRHCVQYEGSHLRGSLEEWETVDLTQSYASGEDKSCPTATVTEIEGVHETQEDERTSTREPHRGGYSLPEPSWEAVGTIDASSWGLSHTRKLALAIFIHPKQLGTFPKRLVRP